MTSVSNAYEMVVKGQNIIRMTFATVDDFRARPGLNGIPLLAPFANRLDEQAFYANGKKYNFDMELGNVRGRSHPRLLAEPRTGSSSRRRPMARRLGDEQARLLPQSAVDEAVSVRPHARDDLSLAKWRARSEDKNREPQHRANAGRNWFHPYFQLTDSTREEWVLSIGAKTHWLLAQNKIPTGETVAQPTSSSQSEGGYSEGLRSRSRLWRSRARCAGSRRDERQGQGPAARRAARSQLSLVFVLYSPNRRTRAAVGGGRGGGRRRRGSGRARDAFGTVAAADRRPRHRRPIAASSRSSQWSGSPTR